MTESQRDERPPIAWSALAVLLLVTVIWGGTFVWMKEAQLAGREVLGPGHAGVVIALFIGLRFGLAALILSAAWPRVLKHLTVEAWRGGFRIGLLLAAGFFLQMFGLENVSPAVSAFLTSLYVLFTAVMVAVGTRRRPEAGLAVGVIVATFGAGFIGGPPQLHFGWPEVLTVLSALVFARVILLTDYWTNRAHPSAVSWVSFFVVALLTSMAFSVLWWRSDLPFSALVELAGTRGFLQPLLLSSVLATAIALVLINHFQRKVSPVRAAVLYALEPIWASLIAIAGGWSVADTWLWIGGAALLLGNLIAEFGARRPTPVVTG